MPFLMRNLIILGSQKSATTTLYYQLVQHPQVIGARPTGSRDKIHNKETNHLNNENSTIDSYLSLFDLSLASAKKEIITIDASPRYTMWPQHMPISRELQSSLADPLYIYILRDPVERFESAINYIGGHRELFMRSSLLDIINHPVGHQALITGNYSLQLLPYSHLWASNRLVLVDYKDVTTNSLNVVSRVLSLLNLNMASYSTIDPIMHANPTPPYAANLPILKIAPSPLKNLLKRSLGTKRCANIVSALKFTPIFSRKTSKRLLSNPEKDILKKTYCPMIDHLEAQYGFIFK